MLKYIQVIINEFKSRIAGIKANPADWTAQKVKVTDLETMLTELETQSSKFDAAESALDEEREASRRLVDKCKVTLKQVDNLAIGIHSQEPVKLGAYGLAVRRPGNSRPVPSKVKIASIVDDEDGEGFVMSWDVVAEADHYEIEKGTATDSSAIVLAPPYPFLKSTSKTSLRDDNVVKGRRYFYRVRAVNASGPGEWSEPVSRVQ